MTAALEISGCVLAGGQGRRLDGADKGLLEIAGQPLIDMCVTRLRPQVSEILISANRNREIYRPWADTVFADAFGDYAGPLAGFLGAMDHARFPYVVTAACDSPFIPPDLAARLWDPIANGAAEISVVSAGGRLQPVFALFGVELRDSLADFLNAGERRISAWFERHRVVSVEFGDPAAFANINTADELERIREQVGSHDPVA